MINLLIRGYAPNTGLAPACFTSADRFDLSNICPARPGIQCAVWRVEFTVTGRTAPKTAGTVRHCEEL